MCDGKNHNLMEVLSSRHSWDESEQVARWCKDCGAIVVDLDYDGRTQPGRIMKMRFPQKVYENQNALHVREETRSGLRTQECAGDNQLQGNHL